MTREISYNHTGHVNKFTNGLYVNEAGRAKSPQTLCTIYVVHVFDGKMQISEKTVIYFEVVGSMNLLRVINSLTHP